MFVIAALAKRRWACVAFEDELELDQASGVANACQAFGFKEGWSVEIPWIKGDWTPAAHRLNFSAEGIRSLSKGDYIGSCYLMVEKANNFAIASDGDRYWMIAGPEKFIEIVVKGPVINQVKIFDSLASRYPEASLEGKRLRAASKVALEALKNL